MAPYPPISFSEPPDSTTLQLKLDSIFEGIDRKDVVVGYSIDGKAAFADVSDGEGKVDASGGPLHVPAANRLLETGCLTKLLTGTLIEQQIADDERLTHEFPVAAYFTQPAIQEALAGITIRHLLNHTHGLDDSRCQYVPRHRSGLINLEALVSLCAAHRLNDPGEIYSYSNAGAWILAAILEQQFGVAFQYILQRELFDGLRIEHRRSARTRRQAARGVCPATGGELQVTMRGILHYLQAVLAANRVLWPATSNSNHVTPLAGWNPFEQGVYRGWKFYGGGWYGHSSIADNRSTIVVRIHPVRRVALVVYSLHHHANMVAARLFGRGLPGYGDLKVPGALPPESARAMDWGAFQGRYGNAAQTISIQAAEEGGGMQALWSDHSIALVPAAGHVWLAARRERGGAGYFQFLVPEEGAFRYLWDGQRLYRNERFALTPHRAVSRPRIARRLDHHSAVA